MVFDFRYRSRSEYPICMIFVSNAKHYDTSEALENLHIIPAPVPLEERPLEDLTVEEARELLRRQRVRAQCQCEEPG